VTPFSAIFVPHELREAVSDRAWLQGMLDAEHALAKAGAAVGLLPEDAVARIEEACRAELYDPARVAHDGRSVGNPAEPLVRELRAAVGEETAAYVHLGATSQDVVDTAAMLVCRRATQLVLAELDRLADGCAELARAHRSTPMAARTLLQQAVPTTFGLKAAGWLVSVLEARRSLATVRKGRLAAQLGGAAGTLAALGDEALEVVRLYAGELGLAEPLLPWHTNRQRVAEVGATLDAVAGAAAKVGRDVVLLAQSEVGEVAEAPGGRSSTMPQKRNPVRSTLAVACARLANAHAEVLLGGLAHEHERAVGGWHAEWEALSGALAFAGGSAAAAADAITGLEVDEGRMRANLEAGGGLVLAERVAFALAPLVGRTAAHDVVSEAAHARSFREALLVDERTGLTADELDVLLDPTGYLGAAEALVDRALGAFEEART
jgi:3-carboxy-cis,cis-muconate cycloisomerase